MLLAIMYFKAVSAGKKDIGIGVTSMIFGGFNSGNQFS